MEIRSIVVLKGKSAYDSTTRFLDEMIQEWKRIGIKVDVLDGYNEKRFMEIKKGILQGNCYDMVFSINGMLWEREYDIMSKLMDGKTICCTHLMDHPLWHHARMKNTYSKLFVLAPDYYHMYYLDKYYPNIWRVGFLAHGGCVAKHLVPYVERKVDISFMGSYINSNEIKQSFLQYGQLEQILLNDLIHYMVIHTSWTIEQAYKHIIQENQMQVTDEEFAVDLSVLRLADKYVRGYFREKVLEKILSAGFVVDVYGKGWEKFQCKNREFLRVHPACDYQESLEIIGNSKISLNVMPWFKAGSHDRVFTAMGCGAIALTDKNEYYEQLAQDGGLVLYDLDALELLPVLIGNILKDNQKGKEISKNGIEQFGENHTWAARADEILLYLQEMNLE